ncbi:MAG: 4Fe-4S dicluster domain-containing protein [Bacteroidia bacterium]|nr:4Fe-4S dicluster domain-containing protein [Bacteroidia bacterium]
MINFGYTLPSDRQIVYDKNNRETATFLRSKEPTFNSCIQCGTCTATCSAACFTDFNFRKLLLLVNRGETFEIIQELQKCMLCGKCLLVCPRNVNTRNILLNLRLYYAF